MGRPQLKMSEGVKSNSSRDLLSELLPQGSVSCIPCLETITVASCGFFPTCIQMSDSTRLYSAVCSSEIHSLVLHTKICIDVLKWMNTHLHIHLRKRKCNKVIINLLEFNEDKQDQFMISLINL